MRVLAAVVATACATSASADPVEPGAVSFDDVDVVVMGEIHDNGDHHLNQAMWLRQLNPTSVVFEMLSPEAARRAEAARPYGTDAVADATGWAESGWPDFGLYAPVFAATGDAALFGADVPRDELRRAMVEGAAAALGDGASILGLDRPLDAAQQSAREAVQASAHCDALPADLLPGMVEAQRLRDAALAELVVAAVLTVGRPVAVITGNGHARTDWAVPALLKVAMPDLRVLSVGQIEAPGGDADLPYDVWTITPPLARADPCATFR